MSSSAPEPSFPLESGLRSTVLLNDGRRMPVVGLGVWQIPPGGACRRAVRHALLSGIRLFDTATLYRNEADVGEALRESGVPREEVFLTTKLWNDEQGYESALRAFERSRRALGVEEVDLYLIHWPVPGRRSESWRALCRLRREGACRSIGVSNYTPAHLSELLSESDVVPAVNQVEFHPFLYQRELLEYCRRSHIQLEAYSPLARGQRFGDPTLTAIARARGRTPAQVMLRWALQHHVIVIPKSARPERISENSRLFDFALTEEEMAGLDRVEGGFRSSWDPSGMP